MTKLSEEQQKEIQKISYAQVIDPKNISIELMWRVYAEACLTKKVITAEAYAEIKAAFQVGFIEAFKLLTDVAADLPEDQACLMFSLIAEEANKVADIRLKVAGVR